MHLRAVPDPHSKANGPATTPGVSAAIEVGQQLRGLRIRAGLSQARAAAEIGCSVTHLQHLEAGAIPLRGQVLGRAFQRLIALSREVAA